MLKALFGSGTRVKLLNLLLFNPGKEFHLREIARLVGVSPIHVKKELNTLLGLNLLLFRQLGKMHLYQANRESPLFPELRGLFIKTMGFPALLKEKLQGFGLRFALVYGSFAQGKETEKSDVDLLLVGKASEDELVSVIQKTESLSLREINYLLWSEKELKEKAGKKLSFLQELLKGKVIMLVGEENEFRGIAGKRANKKGRKGQRAG